MTPRFVTTLRARPTPICLAPEGTSGVWTMRVQVAEAWDAVRVQLLPNTRVADLKRAAMDELMPDVDALDGYVVKLGGFEVANEGVTVEASGATDGSTFLIIARRRRPVR